MEGVGTERGTVRGGGGGHFWQKEEEAKNIDGSSPTTVWIIH